MHHVRKIPPNDRRPGASKDNPQKGQTPCKAREAQRNCGAVLSENSRRRRAPNDVEDFQRSQLGGHGRQCV